jgi:outer membrane lipoprotein-sorting protein
MNSFLRNTLMVRHRLLIFLLFLFTSFAMTALAADTNTLVAQWVEAQTNLHSWSAEFVQTRHLKSLTQPLTATGHVWFAAPNRFRWELGQPPQTIAVRAPTELLVIYPRLKRVEHFSLTGGQSGAWRDAMALLEAGFPRSQAELHAQYNLLSQNITNHTCELILQPKSAAAQRMMPHIEIDFDTTDSSLRGTELEFADGSTMRNDFKNPVLNPAIDDKLFAPDLPADYKNIEPLKKQ